jgi:hypothetical protein
VQSAVRLSVCNTYTKTYVKNGIQPIIKPS